MPPSLSYVAANGGVLALTASPMRLRGLSGTGIAAPEHQTVRTPGRDGETWVRTITAPRYVIANVTIDPASLDALHTSRRDLARLLNPKLGPGVLRYQPVEGSTTYEIDAHYDGGAGFGDLDAFRYERMALSFRCPDPAWRVTPRVSETLDFEAGGLSFPISFPVSFTATGASQSVNNTGDLASEPVIVLTASAGGLTDPVFENETTGQRFALSGGAGLSLSEGESVTVDMRARTARTDDGTNVMGLRSADSEMWSLEPGVNEVSVTAASGAGTAVLSYWRLASGV